MSGTRGGKDDRIEDGDVMNWKDDALSISPGKSR